MTTKRPPRPLTGNHVAKELKKFFRARSIKYMTVHRTIVADCETFPPLVFIFKNDYITVYNKNNLYFSTSFPAGSIATLFLKLIQHGFLTKKSLMHSL